MLHQLQIHSKEASKAKEAERGREVGPPNRRTTTNLCQGCGSLAIICRHYVDNYFDSVHTEEEAVELAQEVHFGWIQFEIGCLNRRKL